MKVEGSATGLINIEVSDGWVEVADEVSSFIHDECYALANELWRNRSETLFKLANISELSKRGVINVLYVLTVLDDLAPYYDDERGEGAFNALTPEQQQSLAHDVHESLETFMEDRYIAFDMGIDRSGL